MSPALAGGFFTTEPPGKPNCTDFNFIKIKYFYSSDCLYLTKYLCLEHTKNYLLPINSTKGNNPMKVDKIHEQTFYKRRYVTNKHMKMSSTSLIIRGMKIKITYWSGESFWFVFTRHLSFLGGAVVKNPPTNTGDASWISGLGRSLRAGNGNPLQYSWLENPMDRGAWRLQSMGSQRIRYDQMTGHIHILGYHTPGVTLNRSLGLRYSELGLQIWMRVNCWLQILKGLFSTLLQGLKQGNTFAVCQGEECIYF